MLNGKVKGIQNYSLKITEVNKIDGKKILVKVALPLAPSKAQAQGRLNCDAGKSPINYSGWKVFETFILGCKKAC